MSNKKKVLSHSNFPSKIPTVSTAVWFLLMERFNAPQWLWCTIGILFIVIWAIMIYGLFTEERVDFFKNENSE